MSVVIKDGRKNKETKKGRTVGKKDRMQTRENKGEIDQAGVSYGTSLFVFMYLYSFILFIYLQ